MFYSKYTSQLFPARIGVPRLLFFMAAALGIILYVSPGRAYGLQTQDSKGKERSDSTAAQNKPATNRKSLKAARVGKAGRKHSKAGMTYIPAGWFYMGCAPADIQCRDDEKPYHRVYLSAYYIDTNNVTVSDYAGCVSAGACTKPAAGDCCNFGIHGMDNYPANCVSWDQANRYCKWAKKRLPTEAEWEKAARGTQGRIYPWGNEWDPDKACFNKGFTCPAGSYPAGAGPYGVMDMAGNVYNWVHDFYAADYYSGSPQQNPKGPGQGAYRVLRGGSYLNLSWQLRTSSRNYLAPADRYVNTGFRCAVTSSKP